MKVVITMKYFRDVLLFPKFDNMKIIEDIRKDCDELYGVIQSHITIVFPFIDDISDENLIKNVETILKIKLNFM